MAQIGEYEDWTDAALESCINSSQTVAQERFIAALELWHRSRVHIAALEATVASMDDVEKSHRTDSHRYGQRIEELEQELADLKVHASLDFAAKHGFRIMAICAEEDLETVRAAWSGFDAIVKRAEMAEAERDELRKACEVLVETGRALGNMEPGWGPSRGGMDNFCAALAQAKAALGNSGKESGECTSDTT